MQLHFQRIYLKRISLAVLLAVVFQLSMVLFACFEVQAERMPKSMVNSTQPTSFGTNLIASNPSTDNTSGVKITSYYSPYAANDGIVKITPFYSPYATNGGVIKITPYSPYSNNATTQSSPSAPSQARASNITYYAPYMPYANAPVMQSASSTPVNEKPSSNIPRLPYSDDAPVILSVP